MGFHQHLKRQGFKSSLRKPKKLPNHYSVRPELTQCPTLVLPPLFKGAKSRIHLTQQVRAPPLEVPRLQCPPLLHPSPSGSVLGPPEPGHPLQLSPRFHSQEEPRPGPRSNAEPDPSYASHCGHLLHHAAELPVHLPLSERCPPEAPPVRVRLCVWAPREASGCPPLRVAMCGLSPSQ